MKIILSFYIFLFFVSQTVAIEKLNAAHAISMHGTPKYEKNFKNFEYVNP